MEIIRIIFAFVFVLFLPGLAWSFVFFPKKGIETFERVALSFAFSIAIVPLLMFYLNLIGIKIDTISVSLEVLGLILSGVLVSYLRRGTYVG